MIYLAVHLKCCLCYAVCYASNKCTKIWAGPILDMKQGSRTSGTYAAETHCIALRLLKIYAQSTVGLQHSSHLVWSQGIKTKHDICGSARATRNRELLNYSTVRKNMRFNAVAICEHERFQLLCLQPSPTRPDMGTPRLYVAQRGRQYRPDHRQCASLASPELYKLSLISPASRVQSDSC